MEDKVSIIVPVYNGEATLDACLESLVHQSYDNLEILLLDDGSKDCSLSICRGWAEKDPRIQVFTHDNHGVSYTRNRGLELFTGDWITFVDCDDTVDRDYVMTLHKGAKEHDVLVCQCRHRELRNGKETIYKHYKSKRITCEEALFIMGNFFSGGICCTFYHRSLLNEGEMLRFDTDIRIGEDHLFWCRAVMKATQIYAAEECLYNYIINYTSATQTLSFESSYTDFLARERSLVLFEHNEFLKSIHVSDWVRIAEETLFLYQPEDEKEKKKRLLHCIRRNRGTLLRCKYMSIQEKIKVLLIGFPCFRRYWVFRQRRKDQT